MDVFADESGYSGTKLMNADSPVFVLATTSIPAKVASELVAQALPAGMEELHFAEQHAAHLNRFTKLIEKLSEFEDQIFVCVAHKPYVTLIKAIDHWIDPMLELRGTTLYESRRNYAIANMTFYAALEECGQDNFFRLLRSFSEMMNGSDLQSFSQFWNKLAQTNCRTGSIPQMFTEDLLRSEQVLGGRVYRDRLRQMDMEIMDVVLTMEKLALSHWSAKTPDFIDYYHDQASEFSQQKWIWKELVSPNGPERTFNVGRLKISYPLKMRSTTFVDSRKCPQIQICDVLASSINFILKAACGLKHDRDAVQALLDVGAFGFIQNGVWPSNDPSQWTEDLTSDSAGMLEHASTRVGIAFSVKDSKKKMSLAEVQAGMNALKTRDYKNAYIILSKAAKQRGFNTVIVEIILGFMHDVGLFVPVSKAKADEWLLKAINNSDFELKYLGITYLMVRDHGADPHRLISLLLECAESGNAEAGYKLAGLYLNGMEEVFQKDLKQGFYWAKKIAPLYTNAQMLLASCYKNGKGVKRNLPLAKHWYKRAALGGNENAVEELLMME